MTKRIFAMVLAACMALTLLPVGAAAKMSSYEDTPMAEVAMGEEVLNTADVTADAAPSAALTAEEGGLAEGEITDSNQPGAFIQARSDQNARYFTNLKYALDAASEGDTVILKMGGKTFAEVMGSNDQYVVRQKDLTIDLGGNTVNAVPNYKLVLWGQGITLQNGALIGADTTDPLATTGKVSYVLVVDGQNAQLNDLTTLGGISVSVGSATLTNVNATGTNYYAVCAQNSGKVIIKSGSYQKMELAEGQSYQANCLLWSGSDAGVTGSHISIEGGAFTAPEGGQMALFSSEGTCSVTGGTFNRDMTDYVADGYEYQEDGTVVEKPKPQMAVYINNGWENVGGPYDTIQSAVDAWTEENANGFHDIILTGDVTENVTVPEGKSIRLKTNDHTWTGSITNNGSIYFNDSSTRQEPDLRTRLKVTIAGGQVDFNDLVYSWGKLESGFENVGFTKWVYTDEEGWFVASSSVSAKIDDKEFRDVQTAINAAQNGETISLEKSTVSENLIIPADKTITIDLNGKKLQNSSSTEGKASSVITNNGTLTIKNSKNSGNGVAQRSGSKAPLVTNNGALNIESGKFTPASGCSTFVKGENAGAITIKGGTFAEDISAIAVPGEGLQFTEGGKGVEEKLDETTAAAKIVKDGGTVTYYKTLTEALAAAQSGETVVVLKDTAEEVTLPLKSFTLTSEGETKPILSGRLAFAGGEMPAGTQVIIENLAFEENHIALVSWGKTTGLSAMGGLTIRNNTFTNATGAANQGDNLYAIHINNADDAVNDLTIVNNVFENCGKGSGGCVYADVCGTLTVTGNTFRNSAFNALCLTGRDSKDHAATSAVISGNVFDRWACEPEGRADGRAMRLSNFDCDLDLTENSFVSDNLPEEYIKLTGLADSAAADLDECYWGGGLPADDKLIVPGMKLDSYYADADMTELVNLLDETNAAAKIVKDGETVYYRTLQAALAAANGKGDVVTLLAAEKQTIALNKFANGLTNVTITAAEGVVCKGIKVTNAGSMREITIKDISFSGDGHCVDMSYEDATATVENITFDGCTFTCGGYDESAQMAIHLYGGVSANPYKNITVRECKFTTCGQGVYVNTVEGLTVTDCTFEDMVEAIHPGDVNWAGEVTLTGNTFIGTGNPIVLFNGKEDAAATITGNTSTGSTGCTMVCVTAASKDRFTILGNTWEGLGDEDTSWSEPDTWNLQYYRVPRMVQLIALDGSYTYTLGSFDTALALAQSGDVLKLLVAPAGVVAIPNDKAVQLDLTALTAGEQEAVEVSAQAAVLNTAGTTFVLYGGVEAGLETEAKLRVPGAAYGGYTSVYLYEDWTLTGDVTLPSRNNSTTAVYAMADVTIDLAGYTVSQTAGNGWNGWPAVSAFGGDLTVRDTSESKTGKIEGATIGADVHPGRTLTLESGTVSSHYDRKGVIKPDGSVLAGYESSYGTVIRHRGGSFVMTGGRLMVEADAGQGHSVIRLVYDVNATQESYAVHISGGEVDAVDAAKQPDPTLNPVLSGNADIMANNQNLTFAITGGVFGAGVNEYCKDHDQANGYCQDPETGAVAVHDLTKWAHDDNNHWHVCSRCDAAVTDTPAAHSWTLGAASGGYRTDACECGAERTVRVSTNRPSRPTGPEEDLNEPDVPLTEKPFLFTDVTVNDWYYDAVKYVSAANMMIGVNEAGTLFAPALNTTRASLAQIMFRLEKEPAASAAAFDDVAGDAWYANAVNWNDEVGLMIGYGDGTFRPEINVRRQELVTVLYRYAKRLGMDVTAEGDLSAFMDGGEVAEWAQDAMTWAVGSGLIRGRNGVMLAPDGATSRSELAAILQRFREMSAAK